ncbi:hybrid sensory histidine kinase TorS [Salmonella enterica subsp. arizonae]|uniref:Hybrid sensory histidine kinase TorS n=1 Tax=Salmonella enterica subsp. arizonae TaxID=59203 RepID=A0A379RZK3_SALER|nr:hybrid sensory histidine kinase TorS [Salmonella enterica subsp. arizonae]
MNDDVNIKRLAHKLKSGCASLGMTQATDACRELEMQPLSDIDIKTIVTQGVTALGRMDIVRFQRGISSTTPD